MEIQLKQIEESLKAEKVAFEHNLDTLKTNAQDHLKLLNEILAAVSEIKKVHVGEITQLLSERADINVGISNLRRDHQTLKSAHTEFLDKKNTEIENRKQSLDNLEEKEDHLNKSISGLMVEFRSVEEQLTNGRGQLSAQNRQIKDLQIQESALTVAIADKQKILDGHDTKIEGAKKEFTRLSNDNAILEARNKQL